MGFADLGFGQCLGWREESGMSTQQNLQRVRTSAFLCERRGSSGAKSEERRQWGEEEQARHPLVGIWGLGSTGPQWSDLVSQ